MASVSTSSYDDLWEQLQPVGRHDGTGGYRRLPYTSTDLTLREWFVAAADERGLETEVDRNGNVWAWWSTPGLPAESVQRAALVVGSHMDSVVDGGAYDGPLGVISAFAAIDQLRASGWSPSRRVAVAAFADEEGARFGAACCGSRLMTGQLDPDHARNLRDSQGTSMADAMSASGHDVEGLGADPARVSDIGAYVELHVEQGRALVDVDQAIAVGEAIWPHGRWRCTFTGRADHAGSTRMDDRNDPMLTYGFAVLAANKLARRMDARATFARLEVEPNSTNAIASVVRAWLDARAGDTSVLDAVLEALERQLEERSRSDGTSITIEQESSTPLIVLDQTLRSRVSAVVAEATSSTPQAMPGSMPSLPVLPTGAGHDAGVLSLAGVPSAMLFVRNPTGVSHSPAEFAERDDCLTGVTALAAVIKDLAGDQR